MTVVSRDDKRLVFVPIEVATNPPSGLVEHFSNNWWIYDIERGVVYWKFSGRHLAPQCNSNLAVTMHLRETMYPWAEVKQIEHVFRRINPHDY